MKLRRPNSKFFSPLASIQQFAIIDTIWSYTHDIMRLFAKRLMVNSRNFKQCLSQLLKIQSKKLKKVIKSIPIRQKKLLKQNYMDLRLDIFRQDIIKKLKQNYSHFLDEKAQYKLYRRIQQQIIIKVIQLFKIQIQPDNQKQLQRFRKNTYKLVTKYRYYFQYNFIGQQDDKIWGQICQIFHNQQHDQIFASTTQKLHRDDEFMFGYLAQQMRQQNVLRKISYKTLQDQVHEFYQEQKQNMVYGKMHKETLKNLSKIEALKNQKSGKQQYKVKKNRQSNERVLRIYEPHEHSSILQIFIQQSSLQQSEREQLEELANLYEDNTTQQDSKQESSQQDSSSSQDQSQVYSDLPQPRSQQQFPQLQFDNLLSQQPIKLHQTVSKLMETCVAQTPSSFISSDRPVSASDQALATFTDSNNGQKMLDGQNIENPTPLDGNEIQRNK